MIILLDTSSPICRLTLIEGSVRRDFEWEANRELAKELLGYIESRLSEMEKEFADITGIGVLRGPGSFTGLRIGVTVCNTLADALDVPIVGEMDDDWQERSLMRLHAGENDHTTLPLYSSEAHITSPRK